ncbi:hypothetical protein OJF2_10090 [Aquisphaera giovannonii]|uniref:DUF4276 domain-containing protein n=1 Tax=Aquisphaera giovannonii TaxID=406548 RepID=A0A5B9VWC8_9BACT|nr:DUF4276 family protein [Aquisphaera giovannonii]QEH32532.1 hypothetical protein OJF2_10090 [Aquisphaera giovannonii]
MARLYLFAEGQTEQTFADTILVPHLAHFGVYLRRSVLIATGRRHGRVHRGGGRMYLPMKNDILRFLRQERGQDVFFTTMIDLYAIHADMPGLAAAEPLRHDPHRRVREIERSFANDIGDPRFIPYIQLHEFEAFLFAGVESFGYFYDGAEKAIGNLKAIADAHASPEQIDDGPQTAPSKRIIENLPGYEGAKPTVGPQVAELIGLATIRAKCPHFDGWVSRLEALGRLAPVPQLDNPAVPPA